MRVLLIKLKNIGDALLMTSVIKGIKDAHPDAEVTVLVREGTESILRGCPQIDRIMLSAAPEKDRRKWGFLRDMKNLWEIRACRYDWVFELTDTDRGRWISAFSGGRNRAASAHGWPMPWYFKRQFTHLSRQNWHLMHRVEKDYSLVAEFLTLPPLPPTLVFIPPEGSDPLVTQGEAYVVIHPVSRWKRKTWPLDRWIAVGRHLISRGMICIISAGPDTEEIEMAGKICAALGENARFTAGKRSWPEMGRLMRRARLFVGLDTAAMHLAAATQCPVVALFGPSIEHHWHPWRVPFEIISPGAPLSHEYPKFAHDALKRSMIEISSDAVIASIDRMLPEKKEVA